VLLSLVVLLTTFRLAGEKKWGINTKRRGKTWILLPPVSGWSTYWALARTCAGARIAKITSTSSALKGAIGKGEGFLFLKDLSPSRLWRLLSPPCLRWNRFKKKERGSGVGVGTSPSMPAASSEEWQPCCCTSFCSKSGKSRPAACP